MMRALQPAPGSTGRLVGLRRDRRDEPGGAPLFHFALCLACADQRRIERLDLLRHLHAGEDIDIARIAADHRLVDAAVAHSDWIAIPFLLQLGVRGVFIADAGLGGCARAPSRRRRRPCSLPRRRTQALCPPRSAPGTRHTPSGEPGFASFAAFFLKRGSARRSRRSPERSRRTMGRAAQHRPPGANVQRQRACYDNGACEHACMETIRVIQRKQFDCARLTRSVFARADGRGPPRPTAPP